MDNENVVVEEKTGILKKVLNLVKKGALIVGGLFLASVAALKFGVKIPVVGGFISKVGDKMLDGLAFIVGGAKGIFERIVASFKKTNTDDSDTTYAPNHTDEGYAHLNNVPDDGDAQTFGSPA